jgi:hypothetical protein
VILTVIIGYSALRGAAAYGDFHQAPELIWRSPGETASVHKNPEIGAKSACLLRECYRRVSTNPSHNGRRWLETFRAGPMVESMVGGTTVQAPCP